jgi:hypothetical protein
LKVRPAAENGVIAKSLGLEMVEDDTKEVLYGLSPARMNVCE